jgi:hypothetical protein
MQDQINVNGVRASRATASLFGALAGIGGITHAVGEIIQGNVAPQGIMIESWTVGPVATNMGGEPGMTIVPNLLLTGILNLIVSFIVLVWAVAFIERKDGGLNLILLSFLMMLVGGGFGPPIIGMLAGAAGVGIHSSHRFWRKNLPPGFKRFLAGLWPWVFGVSAINGLFLVIGSLILVIFFDLNNADLFVGSFFFAVISLIITLFTGYAYDFKQHAPQPALQE